MKTLKFLVGLARDLLEMRFRPRAEVPEDSLPPEAPSLPQDDWKAIARALGAQAISNESPGQTLARIIFERDVARQNRKRSRS